MVTKDTLERIDTTREDHTIAWFAALAITIHVLESVLPSPLPGIKPGLANLVTIAVLIQYGWRMAAWVNLLRVLAGSLLIGTFLSPTFFLSLCGALFSLAVLALALRCPGRGFSAIGLSLVASCAHMSGQFTIAYLVFIPHPGLWQIFPVLMTAAVIFGIMNGMIIKSFV